MSRRKLKAERELVADIKKRFNIFCQSRTCDPTECELFKKTTLKDYCIIEYVKLLLGVDDNES